MKAKPVLYRFRQIVMFYFLFYSLFLFSLTTSAETWYYWPIDTGYGITTDYGRGYSDKSKWHTGVDMATGVENPAVYAVCSGTAVFRQYYRTRANGTRYLTSYGNCIDLYDDDGIHRINYAHLSSFVCDPTTMLITDTKQESGSEDNTVVAQRHVEIGELIGYVGSTGNSTGPHLHFGVYYNETEQDPKTYLLRDKCVSELGSVCNCSESYAGTYICTSNTTLNIRSSHSTSGRILGSIPSGAEVYVSKADGSWAHVSYSGIDGYASMQYLERKANYYTLDLNGLLDDRISGGLEEYGTADVYVNGVLVADDVSDYCESLAEGTTFEFTDFKACDGYIYSGWDGYLKGTISGGNAELKVIFYTDGQAMSSGYNRTIPDGDYLICAAGTTNKSTFYYLDIEGIDQPAANETNVSLCGPLDFDPLSYEAWNLTYKDGFYTIKQAGTNMCLDVCGGSAIQAKNVQVYTSNDSDAQKWAICENGRNGYRIQAKCSGFSLDIDGGLIENGRNVRQWKNNDSAAQSWLFIPYRPFQPIESGRYVLISGISDHLELDVDGDTGDVPENVNVQAWEDSASSKFNSFDIQKLSNGYYKFKHAASGKCLDVSNGTSGYSDNIAIHTDNGSPAQQWAIIPNRDGFCIVAKCSGYAMDVTKAGTENGTNVLEYPIHGANNQTWRFVPAEYSVKYDADGGKNAPEEQTKYYKENLGISTSEPDRDGYEFAGWAEVPGAGSAVYQPGDVYKIDADINLYAVWRPIDPDVVLPDSLGIIQPEAFMGNAFTYVKLPEETRQIGSRAFADCTNLKHIYIPETATVIASDAFEGVGSSLAIHGAKGSYAEFYAGKHGFIFIEG